MAGRLIINNNLIIPYTRLTESIDKDRSFGNGLPQLRCETILTIAEAQTLMQNLINNNDYEVINTLAIDVDEEENPIILSNSYTEIKDALLDWSSLTADHKLNFTVTFTTGGN